ncbi:MAG: RNA pseudouridine synthase [Rhabdochlamydiaceae bacterium]|nr:RNA pseudouridine synthase [Rhabdochlamydiaceae bacterium]
MQVLYFDNHIVVVKKAAGIPSQAVDGASVEQEARVWAKKQFLKKGEVFLYVAHRLDKPVSGIVLLAKTSKALERLQKAFRERRMQKTYIALVEGVLPEDQGVLENYLAQEEFRTSISSAENPQAKLSRLSYKVLEKMPNSSLVEIDLHTGRYHQIRAQFSHLGHPVVGDVKYGARHIANHPSHIALHHQKMEFFHPVTLEKMIFETPPPREWKEWAQDLSLFF